MTTITNEPTPAEEAFRFPVSFAQQRLWFLDRLDPGGSAYNVPLVLRLEGTLDVEALGRAVTALVERHEILRTTFAQVDGEPYQLVRPTAAQAVEVIDVQDDGDPEAVALGLARDESNRPFDLAAGPMLRTCVIRLHEREYILVLTLHHIVADAWSLGVLRSDLGELYRAEVEGRAAELPQLAVQYGDFAVWQREWFQGERLDSQLEYWKQAFASAPSLLELPTDHPRPALQSGRGGNVRVTYGEALAARLEALSRQEGATLFMTLLAGYAALLARYSGQEALVVGTPIANRPRVELEPMIGLFANTLALPIDVSGDPSFRTLVATVRNSVLDASSHQDLPFEQLVAELNPDRSLSHSPLFQVFFQLAPPSAGGSYELPGLEVDRIDLERGQSKWDLALTMRSGEDGLHASFEYSADLFEPETIARMLGHFETLLEAAVAEPDRPVGGLSLLGVVERRVLLEGWGGGGVVYPVACLHELFERRVECGPEGLAVTSDVGALSYRELNERANRVAHRLRAAGVGPGSLVAVCVERSLELVVGVLGVLKAGGAYVPLDPGYPLDRLGFVLADTAASVVVTQESLLDRLPATEATVVCLDRIGDGYGVDNPVPLAGPDDLAYVIYTSGSTGQPKGVAVTHANVARLFSATDEWFRFGAGDTWLLFHSFAFDFSVWELWGALLYGGRLVVTPPWTTRSPQALAALLVEQGVTVFNVTPSVFSAAMEELLKVGAGLRLRYVIFGGEALHLPSLRPWFASFGADSPQLVNMYGITETTVHVTYRPLRPEDADQTASLIGRPIPDLQLYLLDANLEPVPAGVPGEIYVGGAGLARGYLNREQLTAERFCPNPFGPGRLYKSGDRARRRPDGELEYLGRADDQVKIRGYRIELQEIEAVLVAHDQLGEAAVVAREDGPGGDRRLVAYVVPNELPGPTPAVLKEFLQRSLPEFMVPSAFVAVPALPLGPTGKVDRRALPAPERGQTVVDELVPPRTDVERTLVKVWQELLRLDGDIGIKDDFFELGGHSLLAARLMAWIERAFRVKLPLATLFAGATIEQLATQIEAAHVNDQRWSTIVPLRVGGSNPPLFFLHGHDGELLYFRDLVGSLSDDQPAYGIQPKGLDGRAQPYRGLREMASHYADELQAFQAGGPYLLVGYCFSAVLAYELAHQLEQRGSAPELVALIDSPPYGLKRKSRAELERQKLAEFLAADARGKARWLLRRTRGLASKVGLRIRLALSDLFSLRGRRLPGSLANMEDAIVRARTGYTTPATSLRVTLFRAAGDEARARDRRSDWMRLASEVDIHPIAAAGISHDNIVREPYVALLAKELEECVRQALAAP
jgi:amino acid adenylation domain-containing protein